MEIHMPVITEKKSFPAKFMTGILRNYAMSLSKQGKNMCDPVVLSGMNRRFTFPKGYIHEILKLGNCSMEILRKSSGNPDGKIIYDLHGGGYTLPLTNTNRKTALTLSMISGGADIAMLDYRIAPEHTYPSALEDALDGWEKLKEMGYGRENTALFGESAGGNLCLALTAKLRDTEKTLPCCLLLMSPWTDLAARGDSYPENLYVDPLFGLNKYMTEPSLNTAELYAGGTPLDDIYLSPAYGSFSDFPPMMIQAGTSEMLYSDSDTIYCKAVQAGVDVTGQAYTGMFHSFQQVSRNLPESKTAWKQAGMFLRKNLST